MTRHHTDGTDDDAVSRVQDVDSASDRVSAESAPWRIVTRCPSCGSQTLFIGSGGHLTCSLLGCPSPSVAHTIAVLQTKARGFDAIDRVMAKPPAVDASDPHAGSTGNPTQREEDVPLPWSESFI